MKRRATHLLKDFMPGDNATIKVPEFDRGPTDPKNLIVVILEKVEDFYTLGCKAGILSNKYTASDFVQHCRGKSPFNRRCALIDLATEDSCR